MHIDAEALASSLGQLRGAPHEADLVRALRRVVGAVDQMFGYDGAGIMLISEDQRLVYVASSDDVGRALEEAQIQAEQGPCYDAFVHNRLLTTTDVHADERWPLVSEHLDKRVRAVAGLPIRLSRSPVGTLNVYRSESAEWDESDLVALRAYAELVQEIMSAALASHDHSATAAQLQYALDYRVVIERAIGFLMGAHGLDAVTAFNQLRNEARGSRRRVADVAAELLGDPAPEEVPKPPG
jgi:GAF domain-containing protein